MLCRAAFRDKPYANLEAPDVRQFALEDPRGFLRRFPAGALLENLVVLEHGTGLYAIEVKAGATIASDSFKGLAKFSALMKGRLSAGAVVYGDVRRMSCRWQPGPSPIFQ